jgi:hypothetical protein
MITASRLVRTLRRRGLTARLVAVLGIVAVTGAGAVASALLGRATTAIALLAVLVTVAALGLLELRRRAGVADRGIRELRVIVEQTQRRLVVAAEHERVAAADRHRLLTAEISALRRQLAAPGEPDDASGNTPDNASDTPVATIPIATSLRNL